MKKKIVSNVICGVIIAILLIHIVLLLFGYKFYYVKTGSMEPDIPQWSLIYDKTYDSIDEFYDDVNVGSDITYITSNNTIVTHRIIEIDKDKDYIKTQGIIPNATDDKEISYENVIGKVVFSVPLIGFVIHLFKTWYFWVLLISGILMGVCATVLVKELGKKEVKDEIKEENKVEEKEE